MPTVLIADPDADAWYLMPYDALLAFESLVGGGAHDIKVRVYRFYRKWQDPIDCTLTRELVARGTKIYVSVHAWRGVNPRRPIKWRDIANGVLDDDIVRMASECTSLGKHMYFCFNHEPEDDTGICGSAADFVAATEHIMDVFDSQNVTNVTFVVTLMAATYNGDYGGGTAPWMPLRRAYQCGVDGYNRGKCFGAGRWVSFSSSFSASHAYATAHDRKLFIAECGCVEGGSCGGSYGAGAKAAWFDDALRVMRGWSNLEAFCYSHVGDLYPFPIDTSQSALDAFRTLAHDPWFKS